MLNKLGTILYSRFVSNRPFILSHLVTARCNCRCASCLWRSRAPETENSEELRTDEIMDLYGKLKNTGFLAVTLWGGEPLLRDDIVPLLTHAKRLGFHTSLITNGYFLNELHRGLAPVLDTLIVSIDLPSEEHDAVRRCPGLFSRATSGLASIKQSRPRFPILINTVLSARNVERIPQLLHFAKAMGCPINFQAMNREDYGCNDPAGLPAELAPEPKKDQEAWRMLKEFKRRGYPVHNSSSYIKSRIRRKPFRCHYKKIFLRIEPNGDMLDCTRQQTAMLNVRKSDLARFLRSEAFRRFLKKAEGCNRCSDSGVVESSLVWQFRPGALVSILKSFR